MAKLKSTNRTAGLESESSGFAARPEIAIIGYGRFGRLTAHYLKAHFTVFVAGRTRPINVEKGIAAINLEEAAAKPVIILSVAINSMPEVLRKISPLVRSNVIVLDVCSVKERPLAWMEKYLPKSATIIGTHPLFGPDSAAETVVGRNLILCPGRKSKKLTAELQTVLELRGIHTTVMSAEDHDRLMASTLFLTQFVGHGLAVDGLLPKTEATTRNFEILHQLVNTTQNDTKELFRDMYRFNRFAKKIPAKILKNFEMVSKELAAS